MRIVLDVERERQDGSLAGGAWRAAAGRQAVRLDAVDRSRSGTKVTMIGRRLKSGAPYLNLTERANLVADRHGKEIYRTANFGETAPQGPKGTARESIDGDDLSKASDAPSASSKRVRDVAPLGLVGDRRSHRAQSPAEPARRAGQPERPTSKRRTPDVYDHFGCGGVLQGHTGHTVSISADGNTIAVGAPHESERRHGHQRQPERQLDLRCRRRVRLHAQRHGLGRSRRTSRPRTRR